MKCQIVPRVARRPRSYLDRSRALLRWPVVLIDAIFLWLERNRQRRLLHGLSNHMLKDLGLSRADIDQECGKYPWQN
nr:DUF1127 domain-containing protein [uncultured Dongia sp.]